MNILFVHEVDWLKKVVFEIHTFAEYMSLLGHKVFAIDYASMWSKKGLFDLFSSGSVRQVSRVYARASVTLISPAFIKIPILSRISAALFHFFLIDRIIREKQIDAVILYSVPTNGLQTLHAARKRGIPVVFRAIDIPHELVPYSFLSAPTRIIEKRIYEQSDMVLTLSPRLSEYVVNSGAKRNRVKLLPLGVDTRQFRPDVDSTAIRQKWGISKEEKVILFIGTLFDFSGLDSFLYSFIRIKEEIPGARLLIVGDGPQRYKLENIIGELKLQDRVTITGFQPFESMPGFINLASVGINPFLINGATRDIFPGKVIQFLACGRVLVASPLPGMKALLPRGKSGVIYADDSDDMAQKIVHLLKTPEYLHSLEQEGLCYIKQVHSYDRIAATLEAILKEAIENYNSRRSPSSR